MIVKAQFKLIFIVKPEDREKAHVHVLAERAASYYGARLVDGPYLVGTVEDHPENKVYALYAEKDSTKPVPVQAFDPPGNFM